jgi:chromosome segregation ATPase
MKRIMLSLFAVLLVIPAFAQDKAAQIASLKNDLVNVQQNYAPMEKRYDSLTEKKDEIKFAVDAYTKYNDKYKVDVDDFNNKQNAVNRQQELLNPSIQNYQQRLAAHNSHQCVEYNHDGSCSGYNAEANQLDANKAQLAQVQAQIDAAQAPLNQQKGYLDQTKAKLDTIWQNNQDNITKWKADMTQLKADYDANLAREKAIQAQLAALYGSVNSCLQEIPAACQQPAIGPDGKPILEQNCERMHAACSAMFDGNK